MIDAVAVEACVTANQRASEMSRVLEILRPLKPRRVLEVGVESGGSLWAWCQVAAEDAQIMGIDAEWHSTAFTALMRRHPWPAGHSQTLKLWKGDSRSPAAFEAVTDWFTGPVDFLFIDADHSYEAAKQDWDTFRPLVAPGGVVAFHDVVSAPGVARLWREITAQHDRTETVTDPDASQRLGIGIVYS